MKKYRITAQRGKVEGEFICRGQDAFAAMDSFMDRNPACKILDITELPVDALSKPRRSPAQNRANHKARVVQVRNNLRSLVENESNILTLEERVQISRVACKIDRILALWPSRSLDLKLEGQL